MKQNSIFKFILFAFICAFMAASCEGPEGPMGPAGANGVDGVDGVNGKDGKDGTDGTDGVAGNQACLTCHTQVGMDGIMAEYKMSGHGNQGRSLAYPGARAGCMECHSNEGFRHYAVGYMPEENIDFASMINCGTCHGDHVSLEDGITAPMRFNGVVTSLADGVTEFDFGNSSNTCTVCHQSRRMGTVYSSVDTVYMDDDITIDFIVPADSVYVSSSHAGPHYTTMTNNMFGVGGYTDSPGFPMAHKGVGCVGCHMGTPDDGMQNGGHTMAATVGSCTPCHADATDFDINGKATEIHEMEEVIAEALVAEGILDAEHNTIVGVYHKDVFEAFWNYKIVHYDGSNGVHNPAYIMALLEDAKTKLGL